MNTLMRIPSAASIALTGGLLVFHVCQGQALVSSFTGGGWTAPISGYTIGYAFTVGNDPIAVNQLGVWDQNDDGLIVAHDVGIWDSLEQLLAEVSVPSGTGASLQGGFRYQSLAPVTLSANTVYYIGALYPSADNDLVALETTAYTGPALALGDAAFSPFSASPTLAFPGNFTSKPNDGYFGPNAIYTVIPEPRASAAVLGLGLPALAACLRWRLHPIRDLV